MGAKVKRYKVKESNKDFIDKIEFPQFFIKVTASDIFGTDEELLNRESLLKDFKLSDLPVMTASEFLTSIKTS
jgi:type III restriction enzyme